MGKAFIFLGAILAAFSVGMDAYGHHALREGMPPMQWERFLVAQKHLGSHALGLLGIGLFLLLRPGALLAKVAGTLMLTGMALFCGSLYLLIFSGGALSLGKATPLGGVLLMAGWLALALAAVFSSSGSQGDAR